jgi:hypothetical protein
MPTKRLRRAVARACALLIVAAAPASAVAQPPPLVGIVARESLKSSPATPWFPRNYAAYEPDAASVTALRSGVADVTFEAFFGAWCGDSRRQLPRFLKVVDGAGVKPDAVRLIALSDRPGEYKQSPDRSERARRVIRTPTVIVLRNGIELGRVVETPRRTFEADLELILRGAPPPPPYGAEAWVHDRFLDLSTDEFERALATADATVSALSDHGSLSHYAEHDLMKNGRAREAKAVLDLHLRLDPRSASAHALLAEALLALERHDDARTAARASLTLDSGNERARRVLAKLEPRPEAK